MSMIPTWTVAMGTARRTSARTSRELGMKVWSIREEYPLRWPRARSRLGRRSPARSRPARAGPPALAPAALPVRWLVVLEELAPHVPARVHAGDDGVDDACGAVDDVERRVEA